MLEHVQLFSKGSVSPRSGSVSQWRRRAVQEPVTFGADWEGLCELERDGGESVWHGLRVTLWRKRERETREGLFASERVISEIRAGLVRRSGLGEMNS